MPEISIIVPVYKVEQYLPRCIDSILAQTFTDFELLLIDDGSPDNCGKISDEYAQRDCRIRVVHKENGGVSSARNLGIDISLGNYIMFCDSDDYVEPTWVAGLYNAICQDGVFLGVSGFYVEKENPHRQIHKDLHIESLIPCSQYYLLREASIDQFVWNKIFRKDMIIKHSLRFDISMIYGEDAVFVMKYVMAGNGMIGICCDNTYAYQANDESISHKYITGLWECYENVFDTRDKLLNQLNIQKADHIKHYSSVLMWCIHFSINNCLSQKNPSSFIRKFSQLQNITKSRFFNEAVQSYDFSGYRFYDKLAFRSKSPTLIYLLHFVRSIKKAPEQFDCPVKR